jgi:hypothetical protein
MRHIFAVLIICAMNSGASAMPAARGDLALARPGPVVNVAKRQQQAKPTRQRAQRRSHDPNYGIHPLVGSGDY